MRRTPNTNTANIFARVLNRIAYSRPRFTAWYDHCVFLFTGKPIPIVSWYMENILLQSHSISSDGKVVISKIDVPSVTRSYLNRTYTCQATNTNLIQPFHRTVRLELNRKFSPPNLRYKFLINSAPAGIGKTLFASFNILWIVADVFIRLGENYRFLRERTVVEIFFEF